MKLLEYQAKELLKKYGIPVPAGCIVSSAEEAFISSATFDRSVMVKAQVPIGGRGKAGGIRIGKSPEEVKSMASDMLGSEFKGFPIETLLLEEKLEIEKELYLSLTIDRVHRAPVLITCSMGGVDIEEVAGRAPQKVEQVVLDPFVGFRDYQLGAFFSRIRVKPDIERRITDLVRKLYRMFITLDADLIEINPLIVTRDGLVFAADAKIVIDDNAEYRQTEIWELSKSILEKDKEHQAKKDGLTYIKMKGDIGCVVNGAGLAMATMDLVKLYGGRPANFLDIGGSSNPQKSKAALQLLRTDPDIKVVLFNIFGGITRCDEVARGILTALQEMGSPFPIVIRLAGTNEEAARRILKDSPLILAETMVDAVQQAVARTK